MLKGFKEFVMRGNVLDLAVAVVIGAAFGDVVKSIVADLLTPLIALAGGKADLFSAVQFNVHGTIFKFGAAMNAVVSFLLVAAAVYLFVVAPMNALNERRNRGVAPPPPTTKKCPECLTEVPIAAKRCSACTSPLTV